MVLLNQLTQAEIAAGWIGRVQPFQKGLSSLHHDCRSIQRKSPRAPSTLKRRAVHNGGGAHRPLITPPLFLAREVRRRDVFTTFAKSQHCRNWNGRPGSQNRRTGLEDSLYYRESERQSTCCCQGIRRNMSSPPLSAFVPSCATRN